MLRSQSPLSVSLLDGWLEAGLRQRSCLSVLSKLECLAGNDAGPDQSITVGISKGQH